MSLTPKLTHLKQKRAPGTDNPSSHPHRLKISFHIVSKSMPNVISGLFCSRIPIKNLCSFIFIPCVHFKVFFTT